MRCDQARDRIALLVDGELPPDEREAVSAHAAGCPDCGRTRDELLRLRRHLQQAREPAPPKLLDRVSARLAMEMEEARPDLRGTVVDRVVRSLSPYLRRAAVILLACMLSVAGTAWWMQRSEGEAAVSRDVLAAHVRSLLQDDPVQVASADTHTVKPWYAGRLDYSPVVKDLSGEGFQLVGGRLDYVDGRRVAALVYRRRLHQITVFLWPSDDRPAAPVSARVDGFNLLGWSRAGMSYWAVSDLNEGELRELQALL
ncbi:anti-sigma factor family protein [Inquilinus limosus]|uniref:anti-sigma factor family protein n=1 Tax=Inquilinus limosus TaxID=171674 RepID=UPI0003FB66D6|nr:anti-sigma factor [Inquilinus limosus]